MLFEHEPQRSVFRTFLSFCTFLQGVFNYNLIKFSNYSNRQFLSYFL